MNLEGPKPGVAVVVSVAVSASSTFCPRTRSSQPIGGACVSSGPETDKGPKCIYPNEGSYTLTIY